MTSHCTATHADTSIGGVFLQHYSEVSTYTHTYRCTLTNIYIYKYICTYIHQHIYKCIYVIYLYADFIKQLIILFSDWAINSTHLYTHTHINLFILYLRVHIIRVSDLFTSSCGNDTMFFCSFLICFSETITTTTITIRRQINSKKLEKNKTTKTFF